MGELIKELRRRNVFKVAVAYLALAWVVIQVTSLAVPALNLPGVLNGVVFYLGLVGFPFAIFFAWAFELTPQGVRRTSDTESADGISRTRGRGLNYLIIGLLAIGLVWFAVDKYSGWNVGLPAGSESREASIAVLPFVDMSEGGDNQYLGDGIAEEILNALVGVGGLKVASRTSAFSFRGDAVKAEDIGAALNVRHVLEGSVRRSGERIRVTAQLVDAQTGFHLFSRQLDRESEDLFAIENEIAQEIVRALKPSLGLQESDSLVKRLTDVPAAQDLRMKGRYAFFGASQTSLDEAVDYIQRALQLDPDFWLARGELAYALVYRAFYSHHVPNLIKAAEQTAITLEHDPDNAPALLVAAALSSIVEHDHAKAKNSYQKLLDHPPADQSILRFNYSNLYLLPRGETEKAIAILSEEEARNPLAGNLKLGLVQAFTASGNYAKAAEKLEQLKAMQPDHWAAYQFGARILIEQRKPEEALRLALQGRDKYGLMINMLLRTITDAYLSLGRGDEARTIVAGAAQSYHEGEGLHACDIAYGYVMLGDYDEAAKWFTRSLEIREPQTIWLMGFLRGEEGFNRSPIFLEMLHRLNLPAPRDAG